MFIRPDAAYHFTIFLCRCVGMTLSIYGGLFVLAMLRAALMGDVGGTVEGEAERHTRTKMDVWRRCFYLGAGIIILTTLR